MAEDFNSVNERLLQMAESMSSMDKSSKGMGLSFKALAASIFAGENALKGWDAVVNRSSMAKGIDMAVRSLGLGAADLVKKEREMASEVRSMQALTQSTIALRGEALEHAKLELSLKELQHKVTFNQLTLSKELQKLNPYTASWYLLILNSATSLYSTHRDIQREMQAANSNLYNRISLTKTVLENQRMTGASMELSREATRELLEYGYDISGNLNEQVRLVTQMHNGLGMSVRTATEMAAVYDRQLNVSARDVADSIANVVNDTALAADEAGRLAVNLGRAVATLRPGLSKDLAAVNELVGRYEGSLAKLGGQFGGFSDLLTKMTTSEGMLQAGLLGVNNPEFLASEQATKQVLNSFSDYARSFLGDTGGWERALRLQSLSEMFGTSTQQINLMIKAAEEANQVRTGSITVEERYQEQVRASAASFSNLRNSLRALTQEAVIPIMGAVGTLAGIVAGGIETLVRLPGAVTAVTIGFGVSAVFMVKHLYNIGVAFYHVAASAAASATALRAQVLANTAAQASQMQFGFMGPAAGGVLARTMASPITSALLRGFGILATAGAFVPVALELGKWLDKKYGGDIAFDNNQLKETFDTTLRREIRANALRGDEAGLIQNVASARRHFTALGQSRGEAEARIARALEGLEEYVGNVRFAKEASMMTGYRSNDEVLYLKALVNAQAKVLVEAEKQREVGLKAVEATKAQLRQEEKMDEERKRSERLNMQPIFPLY